jgi:hypothetical protein
VLKHEGALLSYPKQLPLPIVGDVCTIEPHFARIGSQQSDKLFDEDALADSGGSDDEEDLPTADVERHVVQHQPVAEGLADVAKGDHFG